MGVDIGRPGMKVSTVVWELCEFNSKVLADDAIIAKANERLTALLEGSVPFFLRGGNVLRKV